MKILLTGFGAFQNFNQNPTIDLVEGFDLKNHEVKTRIFQVNRPAIEQEYLLLLEDFRPEIIINTGLHAGTGVLNLETFAINSLKENLSFSDVGGKLEGLRTSLDTDSIAKELCLAGIPALRSDYAGSYYCNFIYYKSLEWARGNNAKALFLHIPHSLRTASELVLKEGKQYASMPTEWVRTGLILILEMIVAEAQVS